MSTYKAFGMCIETHLPLPMLEPDTSSSATDLVIRTDDIPPCLSGGVKVKHHALIDGQEAWLDFPNIGRFWVGNGREIRTPFLPVQEDQDWYFHLLGPAFMCALTQRNKLPLHACTILVDGKAVLVMGQSGTGKSTLAIGMDKLGVPVLSDDMSAVCRKPDGSLTVAPAYPHVKLQPPLDWLTPLHPLWCHTTNRRHKNYFALETPVPPVEFPLSALYVLDKGAATAIDPLSTQQSEQLLHANTQRRALYQAIRGVQAHRQWCRSVAENIPAFRFVRRYDHQVFFDELNRLIQHARNVTGF